MKEGRFNSFPLPRCVIVETIIPGPRWDANGMISFRNCGELQRLSIVNDMFNSCRGIDNLNKDDDCVALCKRSGMLQVDSSSLKEIKEW